MPALSAGEPETTFSILNGSFAILLSTTTTPMPPNSPARILDVSMSFVLAAAPPPPRSPAGTDRKSTRLNSSHANIYPLSLHDALPIYDNDTNATQFPRQNPRRFNVVRPGRGTTTTQVSGWYFRYECQQCKSDSH